MIEQQQHPHGKMKAFITKYERHLTILAFLAGFIWDNLTLTRVDLWLDNTILSSYIIIAAFGILLLNAYESGKLHNRLTRFLAPWLPYVIQFAFGGLFSGFLVFYSRSGSYSASWPFLLFLILLFIGNEVFKKRYQRLTFQLSVFFIVMFAYSIFLVPVIFRELGPQMFIISGLLSLLILRIVIRFIRKVAHARYVESKRSLFWSITAIYILFNVLYFQNFIPPLPLSIKEIGVYHKIVRTNGSYTVSFEPAPWYRFFEETNPVFHIRGGESAYVYSSIFAPTKITTDVTHEWLRYDDEKDTWVSMSRVSFPIAGGRGEGYRGYSIKNNITPGTWRVDVKTPRGAIIGRIGFTVEKTMERPELKTETK